MKNKLTAWLCLLFLLCSLLTGCGTIAPEETAAPATEPVVTTKPTTEPTTVPTEPKTFFEEQGFVFWEGFAVHETLDDAGNPDGGIIAWDNILDSTECKVTITCGTREETTYRLADTKVDVVMDEYTLAEFDEACKNDKLLRTEHIKNASDSLYKAFKEEDNSLTKEAWLEQYRDYKVIHCKINQTIGAAYEVNNAKREMEIAFNSQWNYNISLLGESPVLLSCSTGNIYEAMVSNYPGVAEVFAITTDTGTVKMAGMTDMSLEWIDFSVAKDCLISDDLFIIVPNDFTDLAIVLPLIATERTQEAFDVDDSKLDEISENAWEEKTFTEYAEGKDHLKYYFLSPNHH